MMHPVELRCFGAPKGSEGREEGGMTAKPIRLSAEYRRINGPAPGSTRRDTTRALFGAVHRLSCNHHHLHPQRCDAHHRLYRSTKYDHGSGPTASTSEQCLALWPRPSRVMVRHSAPDRPSASGACDILLDWILAICILNDYLPCSRRGAGLRQSEPEGQGLAQNICSSNVRNHHHVH